MHNELLDVVDEEDIIIGQDFRRNKETKGFISRNVVVFLHDARNNLLICRRSPTKEIDPHKWDLTACGHVQAGETYDDAAQRELQEEVGVQCPLQFAAKRLTEIEHKGKKLRYHTSIFFGEWSGPVRLNEELTEYSFIGKEELERHIQASPEMFCPAFLEDYEKIKKLL